MNNKSLALRNKIYRFCFLLFSFFLFIYAVFFLINGQKGVISYYKVMRNHSQMNEKYLLLDLKNKEIEDKISRLSINSLDLDYLDEQLRLKTGNLSENEIIIILD